MTFLELIRREGSAGEALARLPELSRRAGGAGVTPAPLQQVEAEVERGAALGCRLLVWGDDDYPKALAALDAPAPVLWTRGRTELLNRDALGMVGARVASASGQRFARGLASELGRAGFVIVSGMARGVDAAAHEGALPTGTVAVLGGGVDDIYPQDNRGLYERLIEDGCVVSESPVGARAQARDFPRRNRIISGLSRGIIVVEAELRSGSLITARLAAEQGREVFAVPGSPLDPRAHGTNDLIRQGAILCEGLDDVLRGLESQRAVYEPRDRYEAPLANTEAEADLSARVLDLLSPAPTPRDEIIRVVGAPAGLVAGVLLELVLGGQAAFTETGGVVRLS